MGEHAELKKLLKHHWASTYLLSRPCTLNGNGRYRDMCASSWALFEPSLFKDCTSFLTQCKHMVLQYDSFLATESVAF